jgi:hypothetical protein
MPHHQDDTMHPDEEATGMTMGERLMQKGAEQAREQTQREDLRWLLAERFGVLPAVVAERIDAAGFADLERWFKRVLPARSLDDVFADE